MAIPGAPPDVWAVLLPVIVGGGIGILGTAVGPLVTGLLQSKAKRRERRLERFEELAQRLYEYERWIEQWRNARMFAQPQPEVESPLSRARTLAAMYFPALSEPISRLHLAGLEYESWQVSAAQRRLANDISNLGDGMVDVYKPFNRQFVAVREAIAAEAERLEH